jgi:beta-lactamase regulating signal transducer with metallopeptidase domain/HEAT repeat protein
MTRTEIVALTLLHFLWQGALIHALLVLLLRVARHSDANVRYAMGVVALALMAISPVITATKLSTSDKTSALVPAAPSADPIADGAIGAAVRLDDGVPPHQTAQGTVIVPVRRVMQSISPFADRLAWLMPWLVGLWLTGVIVLALRLLGGWLHVRSLVRNGWIPDSHTYGEVVQRLKARLHIDRSVQVLESAVVRAPAIIGWLRPALLIPASMSSGLTVAQLETILAHELAHVRRHDYAVNLLQSVIETVLFYHPGVWWVSRQIRLEREHCCDDLAVATSGNPRLYASALLELEARRLAGADLAMAATGSGGSLLHRVRRLLTPVTQNGRDGSRWPAGVLVLAALLFIAGGTRLLNAEQKAGDQLANPNEKAQTHEKERVIEQPAEPPDTVIVYRGDASLERRWEWAQATARQNRFRSFWIGYVVAGNVDRGWIYFDRHSPVRAAGGSTFYGHMRMKGMEGLMFSGTRLDSVVPGRAPSDMALILGFVVRDGRAVLDRVHAGNFVFPVSFDRRALIWLGESDDAPSVRLAENLYASAPTSELQKDIIGIVGVHTDSDVVRPVLTRWLERGDEDEFRAEVVEWLGYHADARTLGLLARTAREDRSSRVRSEAAETVGDVELPAALDTLVALTSTLRDTDARREAVEGLGHRTEPRAIDALMRIIQDDKSTDIQREAVEALGERKDERVVKLIEQIAREHQSEDVRREAVETLGEAAPVAEAVRSLRRIIDEDRSVNIQREAVETLTELEDPRVLQILTEIAERHREVDVQRQATESMAHFRSAEARRVLERLVRTHQSEDVRREALETLAETVSEDSAVGVMQSMLQGDGERSIKMEALEALSEMKSAEALTIIIDVAKEYPDRQVRKRAIELLGESRDPRARDTLERLLRP